MTRGETIVFSSGRIFYDLLERREQEKREDLVLIRIEQLYPLHKERLKEILESYAGFKRAFWLQEEPKNMGAWNYIHSLLSDLLPKEIPLSYCGPKEQASPAVGSQTKHRILLQEVLDHLFKG